MFGRLAATVAVLALAGCASVEPVGRNAQRAPTPIGAATPSPAQTATPTPAPVQTATPTPAPAPLATGPAIARAPLPAPTPAPAAAQTAPQVVAQPAPQPAPTRAPVAAPQVTVPTPAPAPTQTASRVDDGDDIVVPGQRDTQVPPPDGDPRSRGERMEDIRAWDQCVTQVQAAFERDPMRPQMNSPEDYCSRSLGMRNRTAVPDSRRR